MKLEEVKNFNNKSSLLKTRKFIILVENYLINIRTILITIWLLTVTGVITHNFFILK